MLTHPWLGCNKRFTQSSNLSAHEKVHYIKDGSVNTGGVEDFNAMEDIKNDEI